MNKLMYIEGNVLFARASLSKLASENSIYIDNDEIDFVCQISGKVYAFSSSVPFGQLTIAEYYAYQTALIATKYAIETVLDIVGLNRSVTTKLSRLSAMEYRQLQIATKIRRGVEQIIINCDCIKHTRRNVLAQARLVKSLLDSGYKLIVSRELKHGNQSCLNVSKRRLNKILSKQKLQFSEVRAQTLVK